MNYKTSDKKIYRYSFIIPALNEENFISECIKSIKRQHPKKFEIIVVDNGSKDKTPDIARNLGCRVVKEKRRGISRARNKGALVARGEYLCFIDADGVLSKNWLSIADRKIDKGSFLIDGLIIYSHKYKAKEYYYNIYTLFIYLSLIVSKYVFSKHFVTGNNMVIKTSVFKKVKGFNPVVAEQISFSKKLWKIDIKTSIDLRMIIYYSSRRFDYEGYIQTLFRWIKAAVIKTSDKNYYLKRVLENKLF